MSAFQAVSRLSSRPGHTRCARTSYRRPPRALEQVRVDRRRPATCRMLRPSKFGPRSTPQCASIGVGVVPEQLAQLRLGPHVELALLALGVGVERGVEAALGAAHLAQRPVERLLAHAAEELLAGQLPGVQVGACEQRVVVEHLLEVRHEPVRVDGVAREPAADLVVDAALAPSARRVV